MILKTGYSKILGHLHHSTFLMCADKTSQFETWSPVTIANLVTQIVEVVTFASSGDPPQYSRHQGALRRTGKKKKLANWSRILLFLLVDFLFTLGSYSVSWHFSQKL